MAGTMSATNARPFLVSRSAVPREFTQPGALTLLSRQDPSVFVGTSAGIVMCWTIIDGNAFHEEAFRKPARVDKQGRVRANGRHFGRTLELQMRHHGGLARTARDGPGQPLTMKAFYHPSGSYCIAGFDPKRKQWVVEG